MMRSHRFVFGAFPFKGRCDAIFADANDQSLTNLSMSFQAQIRMVFFFLTLYKAIDRDKFQWQANLSTTNWPSCSKYFDKKRLGQLIIQLKNKNHKYWQVERQCPASAQNHILYIVLCLVKLSLSASKRPAQGWTVSINWARLCLLFARVTYLLQYDSLHTE